MGKGGHCKNSGGTVRTVDYIFFNGKEKETKRNSIGNSFF
jgi:hypothetical protein